MRRYNEVLGQVFDRVCRGSKMRRKIAVTATARRLLVICWAMLRDGTRWRGPTGDGGDQAAAVAESASPRGSDGVALT